MPLIGAPAGTYVTARLYKRLASNPALSWANTYEFHALEQITQSNIDELVGALETFETTIHAIGVTMDRAVISTWVEDGEPYDPTTFISVPLVLGGTRVTNTDLLSLNYCLFVRRATTFGQNGKIFYRRVLQESDVNSPSGTPALSNLSGLESLVSGAMSTSGLGGYLGAGTAGFQMVMKSNLLINREVTQFQVAGARIVQYNNRYFDVP